MSKRWGWAGRGLLCILLWPATSHAKLTVRTDSAWRPDGYYIVREDAVKGILGRVNAIRAKVWEQGFYHAFDEIARPPSSSRYYIFAVCNRIISPREKFISGSQEEVTIRCP